jgi:hypothetical protein
MKEKNGIETSNEGFDSPKKSEILQRGLKGLSLFIIFYSPILDLIGKSGYMSFLGRPCVALLHVII